MLDMYAFVRRSGIFTVHTAHEKEGTVQQSAHQDCSVSAHGTGAAKRILCLRPMHNQAQTQATDKLTTSALQVCTSPTQSGEGVLALLAAMVAVYSAHVSRPRAACAFGCEIYPQELCKGHPCFQVAPKNPAPTSKHHDSTIVIWLVSPAAASASWSPGTGSGLLRPPATLAAAVQRARWSCRRCACAGAPSTSQRSLKSSRSSWTKAGPASTHQASAAET